MTEPHEPIHILVVCTGNICRSAFAHRYLADRLERRAPGRFTVASAGTAAFDELEVPGHVHRLGAGLGLDFTGHRARFLRPEHVHEADLVLTATGDHRRQVLAEVPGALQRTFTIVEFARIVTERSLPLGPDVPGVLAAIATAARHRRGGPIDIDDPYGGGAEEYDEMARHVMRAVDALVAAVPAH